MWLTFQLIDFLYLPQCGQAFTLKSKNWGFPKKRFCLKTATQKPCLSFQLADFIFETSMSTLPWISSLPAWSTNSRLVSFHNCVSQFLKIVIKRIHICVHISRWFCFPGESYYKNLVQIPFYIGEHKQTWRIAVDLLSSGLSPTPTLLTSFMN